MAPVTEGVAQGQISHSRNVDLVIIENADESSNNSTTLEIHKTNLGWETEIDSGNPLNWSASRKWITIAIVSFIELLTFVNLFLR